uniref:Uncharacterized protein n=1 Tax=Oryza brachyantha TaxID=4533 RepID=J3NAG0_ORYBR
MPGLDDAPYARWWRWRGEHRAVRAPCCHVEGRGSTACSDGSSEEKLRWINRRRRVRRSGWRVIRGWRWRQVLLLQPVGLQSHTCHPWDSQCCGDATMMRPDAVQGVGRTDGPWRVAKTTCSVMTWKGRVTINGNGEIFSLLKVAVTNT